VYDADGKNPRLFAQGLRNAEGLDFVPGTNNLWVVVNNRDNAPYPYQNDFDGDGVSDYGKVMQSFVDNYPPEPFTAVRDGGNYGWPFCNSNPSSGVTNMPFDNDMDMNPVGAAADCSKMDRVSKGIQAHSAPLGVSFVKNSSLDGAVAGLHGSWNRAVKTGYKVIYFPWQNGQPADQADLVTGFLEGGVWGRPVDVIGDGAEGLFISDDYAGAVYHLEPK
jgi:glucose/arabinose dehydrogenase